MSTHCCAFTSGVARFRGALCRASVVGPLRFQTKKKFKTLTYNITNQAANLKLSHTITVLTNVCDSPNRTILKCSFVCLLLHKNIHQFRNIKLFSTDSTVGPSEGPLTAGPLCIAQPAQTITTPLAFTVLPVAAIKPVLIIFIHQKKYGSSNK